MLIFSPSRSTPARSWLYGNAYSGGDRLPLLLPLLFPRLCSVARAWRQGGGDVYLDVNLYNSFDSSFNVNLFMYSSIDISFVIYPNHNRRHHHLCGWTRCKIEGG